MQISTIKLLDIRCYDDDDDNHEVIVEISKDPQNNPVLYVHLGGITILRIQGKITIGVSEAFDSETG